MRATLIQYLTFNGNAAETMKFYHSILCGKLNMQTFDEAKMAKTPAEKDRIMHATLETDAITLMASDAMINQSVKFGDNVSLSISGQDKDKLARIFDRLANGGMARSQDPNSGSSQFYINLVTTIISTRDTPCSVR